MALVGNERFVFAFACHRITPNIRNAFHTTFATLSAFYFSRYYQPARQPARQQPVRPSRSRLAHSRYIRARTHAHTQRHKIHSHVAHMDTYTQRTHLWVLRLSKEIKKQLKQINYVMTKSYINSHTLTHASIHMRVCVGVRWKTKLNFLCGLMTHRAKIELPIMAAQLKPGPQPSPRHSLSLYPSLSLTLPA